MTQAAVLTLVNLEQADMWVRGARLYSSIIDKYGYQTIDYFGVDLQVPNGFYWWVCCDQKYGTTDDGVIRLFAGATSPDDCRPKYNERNGLGRWNAVVNWEVGCIVCVGGNVDICNNTSDQCRNSLIGVDLRQCATGGGQLCLNDIVFD